jgi:ABC-2 type transport system ATP-binding protein
MTEEPVSDDDVAAVQATGLGARYGHTWALRDCTFIVPRGSVTVLTGPNGAGKSTLLAIAAGLTVPTTGHLTVLGTDVTARMHPNAAYVSQTRTLPPGLTVGEIIRMVRALNTARWAPRDLILRLIQDRGICLKAKAGTLSDGARSLISICLALARRPDVILLDEPFAALDPLARDEVLRLLMAEVADRAMTVLLSSHTPGELGDVTDHVVLLGRNTIALTGAIDDVLADHRILTGPAATDPPIAIDTVIHRSGTERQTTQLIRGHTGPTPGWDQQTPDLDTIILGYLRASASPTSPATTSPPASR